MVNHIPRAAAYLAESSIISIEAIQEDQVEEIESYHSAIDIDNIEAKCDAHFLSKPDTPHKRTNINHSQFKNNLKKASEGVVVTNTQSEYQRLWTSFTEFCVQLKLDNIEINKPEDVVKLMPNLPAEFPDWIAEWIMDRCDEESIWTCKVKDPSIPRVNYGTAQKMRAAISHKFGRDFGLGTQPWTENPLKPGEFIGNPLLSVVVSQYMISLRRRKVRAGEVVTSARAMDEPTMKKLYEFNMSFEHEDTPYTSTSWKWKQEHPECWATFGLRLMLMLLYTVSMLCLLRYDEALRITWADVHFENLSNGLFPFRVHLDLPFRKTHQHGGIAPFYLYACPEKPWMCPVCLFARWWALSDGSQGGYVFWKKMGNRFSANPFERMTSESFLDCFHHNLCDINIDPRPYGTHSFRRRGCQYLAMVLRWPFHNICTGGGWAENFDNPGTIFKYLLSWTDTPMLEREDYFNPN